MSNSDILLHDNQIEVVATDGSGLVVTTEEGADPDATLRPKWASLTLGGGAGSNSDGDIKLKDRDGNTRVHFDGKGNGPADPETTQVFVDGRGGKIELGKGPTLDEGDDGNALGEIEIWGNYSGDNYGQADIRMQGASPAGPASIQFWHENSQGLQIEHDYIRMSGASLGIAERVDAGTGDFGDVQTITAEAGAALSPPGEDTWSYDPGEITVLGADGTEDDQVETVEIHGQPANDLGGAITLRDDRELTNVEIRAGNASIKLGGRWGSNVAEGGPQGRPGKIILDDAAGKLFEVVADDGVLAVEDLKLNDTLFEIDMNDQKIRTKYAIEEESL